MADWNRDKTELLDKCMLAMKEDLAPWMSRISGSEITVETLMEDLDTGVVLCRLANVIQNTGEEFLHRHSFIPRNNFPPCGVTYKERTGFHGSFIARDNVANFIRWCRELGVSDVIMFETEDLVLHKNEKSVILTLMEMARLSVKFGLEPPDLVRMENEIDEEIKQQPEEVIAEPVIRLQRKNKSHSLDDLVYQVLEQCTCPVRYPVFRVGEGKYRVGEAKSLIFVRVMRKHVMVRVGGGWDTLERYFEKHDPCKITERQRRNSVKSPRSRSGSDVMGRSPSSMSLSSSDSHDSCGVPVSHGRAQSWSSPHNSSSQLKSPRDPVRQVTSRSPSRSPSPSSSPRLQPRQRRDTLSRDTPPRTIDTQARGRLTRKSKSMQELNLSPSYYKPTSSSIRRQSVSASDSASKGANAPEQSRRKSVATTPRKSSITRARGESPSARSRLSQSGPVDSQRPRSAGVGVSRSASFGSRPRTLIPVMEPRSKTMASSQPARETQRRGSSAIPGRADNREETQKRELSARRRSSSVATVGKARSPSSPKPAQRSTEEKQERRGKPITSKIPSHQHKPDQQATRKISTGSTHRTLPSTPRERKPSTARENGLQTNGIKADPKGGQVKDRGKLQPTPPSPRKELVSKPAIKDYNNGKATKKITKTREEKKGRELGGVRNEKDEIEDDQLSNTAFEDSTPVVNDGELNGQHDNSSEHFKAIDESSLARDISSPDERPFENLSVNGKREMLECSFETDSDVTSDLLSDLTDIDYDLRSQRYSGLSEASSDLSFGTSPASRLFHSVDLERNTLETTMEPENSQSGHSQQSLRDCLFNLNLQGSVTPTMKRRIFEDASAKDTSEEPPDKVDGPLLQPQDKAMFFDVEKSRNDRSPDEEDSTSGSPKRWSLVQSLISSIEKRGNNKNDSPRGKKNFAAVGKTSYVISAGKHKLDKSTVGVQLDKGNYQAPRVRSPSPDELIKDGSPGNDEIETEHCVITPDEENDSPRDQPVYDINKNVSNSNSHGSAEILTSPKQIPGEKPFENSNVKTRKSSSTSSSREKRRKDKEIDAFPRPQRQFTLEEMIADMLPADGEL